jgi:putative FmdB family regulatory protein
VPVYEYRCRECGLTEELNQRYEVIQCSCRGTMKRVFSFSIGTAFQPHFNYTVGEYVSSSRAFDDALRRRADENSAATGMEHRYVRTDPGDLPAPTSPTQPDPILSPYPDRTTHIHA